VFHSQDILESEVFLAGEAWHLVQYIPTAASEIETLGEDSTSEVHDTDGDDVGSSAKKTTLYFTLPVLWVDEGN
jgi:hypothetical protein